VLSQLVASIAAMGMICATFPSPIDKLKGFSVTPNPNVSLANALFMEMMLTFTLVFVIFTVAFDIVEKPEKGTTSIFRSPQPVRA